MVQVACSRGPEHTTVVLTDTGHVLTGTGLGSSMVTGIIDTLPGLEVRQLAAGANYFAAVTAGGQLYTLGHGTRI